MGGNHQDEWKAATWELHSHQDKTKGEEIALTQAHTIFVQSNSSSINFNLSNTKGRSSIYKRRSLGEQGVRVGREEEMRCGLSHWLWSMSHHNPKVLEARLSFLPYKASWAKKLGTTPKGLSLVNFLSSLFVK